VVAVEAPDHSSSVADAEIKVKLDPNGSQPDEPVVCEDTVRCTLIRLEFVIPDAYDEDSGLPLPDAAPVPTEFVGVSDPRPTVTLDEISASDVVVRDPIADNVPRGKVSEGLADIDTVKLYIDGEPYGPDTGAAFVIPVTSGEEPERQGFWCQHPYKGTFGPVTVRIPLTEGTHVIRVETSENAAGNTGFDEVAVTLEKREIPGTSSDEADVFGQAAVLNLYLPQAPTPDQADSLQYYRGEREPDPEDPTLTETGPDTLVFSGEINGLATEITLLDYQGLTTEPDTITARIAYTISGVQTSQDLTLTETGPETCIFRMVFSDPTPETLEANIYLPVSPTDQVADSLQYYYGEREPLPDDPILTESEDAPSSLIFTGTFASTPTTITIDPTTFDGLTENADSFQATTALSLPGDAVATLSATFTETGAETCLFRAAYESGSGDDTEGWDGLVRWAAADVRNADCWYTHYRPVCLRVSGLAAALSETELDEYSMTVNDAAFRLDLEGSAHYLKGLSRWLLAVEPGGEPYRVRVWEDSDDDHEVDPGEIHYVNCADYPLRGDFRRNGAELAGRKVGVFLVDLDVDTDRSGACDQWQDELGEDKFTRERGAVVLVNSNSDRTDSQDMDMADTVINDGGDADDTAPLVIRPPGQVIREFRPGIRAVLRVSNDTKGHLRVFRARGAGCQELLGPGKTEAEIPVLYLTKMGDHEMAVEALHYMGDPAAPDFDGSLTIELVYQKEVAGPQEWTRWRDIPGLSDKVHLQVAPLAFPWNGQPAENVYANPYAESEIASALQGSGVAVTKLPRDAYYYPWIQDCFEFASCYADQGHARHSIPTILDLRHSEPVPDAEEITEAVRVSCARHGYLRATLDEDGGNIEVAPPNLRLYRGRLGPLIVGTETSLSFIEFAKAQRVQLSLSRTKPEPVMVKTRWIDPVHHADEVVSFVPTKRGRGYALVVPSPELALDLLHELFCSGHRSVRMRVGIPDEGTQTLSVKQLLVAKREGEFQHTTLALPFMHTAPDNYPIATVQLTKPLFVKDGDVLRLEDEYLLVVKTSSDGKLTNAVTVDRETLNRELTLKPNRVADHCPSANRNDIPIYVLSEDCKWNIHRWKHPQHKDYMILSPHLEINGIIKRLEDRERGIGERVPIVYVPVLYKRHGCKFQAYTANFVNMLVAGGKAIMQHQDGPTLPTESCSVFEKAVIENFAEQGVNLDPVFEDAWKRQHMKRGEFHCGSQTKRASNVLPNWWASWE